MTLVIRSLPGYVLEFRVGERRKMTKAKRRRLKHIEVSSIKPRHPATDPALVERLKENMSKHGWCGRPLLVVNLNPSHEIQD